MRMIDADRLKAEIMGWCVVTDDLFGMGKHYEREIVLQAIEESPTIDAMPVVRCGECLSAKWYESGDFYCQKWGERCDSPYTSTGQSKTDFCSHGSKKKRK